jgi:hypothetical protein
MQTCPKCQALLPLENHAVDCPEQPSVLGGIARLIRNHSDELCDFIGAHTAFVSSQIDRHSMVIEIDRDTDVIITSSEFTEDW